MELQPFAAALWLLWFSFLTIKIAVFAKTNAKLVIATSYVAKSIIKATLVIGGVTASRLWAPECSQETENASSFLAGTAVVAIAVDLAVATPETVKSVAVPSTGALSSALTIVLTQLFLRSEPACRNVAAPLLTLAVASAVFLSSITSHI